MNNITNTAAIKDMLDELAMDVMDATADMIAAQAVGDIAAADQAHAAARDARAYWNILRASYAA